MIAAASLVAVAASAAAGAPPDRGGYLTDEDPFITLAPGMPGAASVTPIMSSGEQLGDFTLRGLPDGIGLRSGAKHTVEVYLAHEETHVPFNNSADLQDASVSKLTLSTRQGPGQGGVLDASVALGPEAGFLRFCSAAMLGPDEGFDTDVYFTGEETNDVVPVVDGAPYDADPGAGDGMRQAGYAVALDTATGEYTQVAGLGRLNHENTVGLQGYDEISLLTTDDTFSRPSAQVYMYRADDQAAVFGDEGELWAFRATGKNGESVDPADQFNGANDYGDVQPGDDLTGEFIPVPEDIAKGTTGDLPQTALENWSNDNNVFQFVRAEDIAVDANDPHVVYMADTGGTGVVPNPLTGRLTRGSGGISDNGAIFRFEFDHDDATVVTSFTKIAQGDDPTAGAYVPFVSPDNIGTSHNSLMVSEDTDGAKIWQLRLRQGTWRHVATVADDTNSESSGIVDASKWFGGGAWMLDVQDHDTFVEQEQVGDVLYKTEAGQLLLMTIPGS